jgi:transposase
VQVQIARDMISRVRELTRAITPLYEQLADLVTQAAPQLPAEKGLGVLIATKLIGEIAGVDRFTSDAQLARISGCAPIPVSSGRTDRHRLDPGGNRQLNHAFHMLALTKSPPRPALKDRRGRQGRPRLTPAQHRRRARNHCQTGDRVSDHRRIEVRPRRANSAWKDATGRAVGIGLLQ